ncbi:hypothetical protein R1flu_013962 [Riccia fluitans]|uniref:Uncharacterized protein n=1 Tax=Riccia fluitans TaxID=41844 RepID=A0ABD1YER9_9MARC
MASSIAVTALWRCPATSAPAVLPQQHLCWSPLPICFQHPGRSKEPLIFVGFFHPRRLGCTKIRVFHTVNCQQRQEEQGLVGTKSESGILHSRKENGGDGTKFLAATEGVCILVAGASYAASAIQKSKQTASVAAAPAVPNVLYKLQDLSAWQVPALCGALVINAVLRTMQMRSSSNKTERKWEENSIKDFTVDQRIGKLEDDMQSLESIAQMLSRHLEKLGVRFRLTRRTLQDPIQETATLALKTSELVSALASREDTLEAELHETRKELRKTQHLLVSLQESQEKQLELLVTAMTKTLKSQRVLGERLSKHSEQGPAGMSNRATKTGVSAPVPKSKISGPLESAKSNLARTFGGLKESYMKKVETSSKTKEKNAQVVDAEKTDRKNEPLVEKHNGNVKVIPSTDRSEKKITTIKSDTKEDFWANTTTTSAAELSVEHEVVDYLTSPDRNPGAVSRYSENPQGNNGRLDSFFSARKNINPYEPPTSFSSQEFHNTGLNSSHSESGDSASGSGKHWESTMGFGFSFDSGFAKDKRPSYDVSPDNASGATSQSDFNSWSSMSGGDTPSVSASGSPPHSSWSGISAWDMNNSSESARHSSCFGASSMDFSSGSGSSRMGEGMINFVQAGFVDTEFMRDFKDGHSVHNLDSPIVEKQGDWFCVLLLNSTPRVSKMYYVRNGCEICIAPSAS